MKWMCVIGLHDWEVTPPVYQSYEAEMLALPTKPATRTCRHCAKMQEEDRICLGLNPPDYHSTWITQNKR